MYKLKPEICKYLWYIGTKYNIIKYRKYILTPVTLDSKEDVFLIFDLENNRSICKDGKFIHADLNQFTDDLDSWIINNRKNKLIKILNENKKTN